METKRGTLVGTAQAKLLTTAVGSGTKPTAMACCVAPIRIGNQVCFVQAVPELGV